MKLYKLKFENRNGVHVKEVAARDITHAIERLYAFELITKADRLKDVTTENLRRF